MKRTGRRAFTLIELLVVVAIMAAAAAFSIPAALSMLRSSRLGTTGQAVADQLAAARQAALSRNHSVEVRFYQLPDFGGAATAAPAVYRAVQSFLDEDDGTATPLGRALFFPQPVVLSGSAASTLLGLAARAADSLHPLPLYGGNYRYVSFRFRLDGSTDVLTAASNCVTLVAETDKAGPSGLPANFVTVQIDPVIGTVRSYRP